MIQERCLQWKHPLWRDCCYQLPMMQFSTSLHADYRPLRRSSVQLEGCCSGQTSSVQLFRAKAPMAVTPAPPTKHNNHKVWYFSTCTMNNGNISNIDHHLAINTLWWTINPKFRIPLFLRLYNISVVPLLQKKKKPLKLNEAPHTVQYTTPVKGNELSA